MDYEKPGLMNFENLDHAITRGTSTLPPCGGGGNPCIMIPGDYVPSPSPAPSPRPLVLDAQGNPVIMGK